MFLNVFLLRKTRSIEGAIKIYAYSFVLSKALIKTLSKFSTVSFLLVLQKLLV